MTKRIIGLVLALCLIVGLLPMIALAENEITSTLAVTTGTNANLKQWNPTLSAGMTPAYAKTTTDGLITTDGASATDYNLMVEWPAGGTPTLTMNGATLTNSNANVSGIGSTRRNTITIGGTGDFMIQLKGTNVINGNPTNTSITTAAYRCPTGIYATNKGLLTIKGESKADSLLIDNKGGHGIDRRYGALTIDSATITMKFVNKSGGQHGILMQYEAAGYEDKTNLTVRNAKLDFDVGPDYSNHAVLLTSTGDKTGSANDQSIIDGNTSDILFQNSEIIFKKTKVETSSTQVSTALVHYGKNSTFTIDRCDVTLIGRHRTVNYAPIVKNCSSVQVSANWADDTKKDFELEAGAAISGGTAGGFYTTHTCGTAIDDFDCTTPNTCDMCGQAIGTAQTAHTPEADDGDCTTEVKCANAGCKQVATAAKAAHTPENDDGDCTTAIKCSICGTETTPANATHTAPATRTDCDQPADCTVCGKALAVGEHTGGKATCQAKANCAVCGQAYGEIGTHEGGIATCTKKAECDTCHQEYGEFAPHTEGTPATCAVQAVCSVCNQSYGEKTTDHVAAEDDGDCTTAIACTVCGGEAIAAKTHTYTNSQDANCDNPGCTAGTRVIAPKPEFKISFATAKGGDVPTDTGSATLKMKAGDPTKYYISGNFDTTAPNDYFCKELTDAAKIAAGEWNMMIEYPADGIPTVTIKKLFIQNKGALQFGGWYAPYEGPAKLIIAEDSIINSKYGYKSTLRFTNKGDDNDVTVTSLNNAKLTLVSNTLNKDEGAIKSDGNLTLDNANIECVLTEYNGIANGVTVNGGNLTIKGGSLRIHAWDDPNKTGTHKEGEEANYLLNANACYAGLRAKKVADSTTKLGNITIEGGANVYLAISVCSNAADADKRLVASDGVFTIKDSTVEMGLVGKCIDGAKLFSVKPTLEFTNNAYTVTATKTKKPTVKVTAHELDQWARYVEMTPDASKVVDWASTTSLGSITYFKVVPGGNGGNGTVGGGATGGNDNTGDISILLTAGIALASAVSFGGVTILRKKEN